MKHVVLNVRLDAADKALLQRAASDANMSLSEFVRESALRAAASNAAGHGSESSNTSSDELAQLAQHVAQLTSMLSEHMRVPTFREFRARMFCEERKQATEDDVVRYAKMYYTIYRVWPDISDEANFGSTSERLRNIFPRNPQ